MAPRAPRPPSPLTPFEKTVARVVKAIPRGRTRSYAQVALLAGVPGGARAVVRALHGLAGVPWWRVVRSDGTIAEQMMPEQAERLRQEGVRVEGRRVKEGLAEARAAMHSLPGAARGKRGP